MVSWERESDERLFEMSPQFLFKNASRARSFSRAPSSPSAFGCEDEERYRPLESAQEPARTEQFSKVQIGDNSLSLFSLSSCFPMFFSRRGRKGPISSTSLFPSFGTHKKYRSPTRSCSSRPSLCFSPPPSRQQTLPRRR